MKSAREIPFTLILIACLMGAVVPGASGLDVYHPLDSAVGALKDQMTPEAVRKFNELTGNLDPTQWPKQALMDLSKTLNVGANPDAWAAVFNELDRVIPIIKDRRRLQHEAIAGVDNLPDPSPEPDAPYIDPWFFDAVASGHNTLDNLQKLLNQVDDLLDKNRTPWKKDALLHTKNQLTNAWNNVADRLNDNIWYIEKRQGKFRNDRFYKRPAGDRGRLDRTVVDNSTRSAINQAIRQACFVAGTPVHTPSGPRPVETIAIGDEVLSFNESTGRVEPALVTGTLRGERGDLIDIDTPAGRLTCSANHSFYTSAATWEKAEDLPPQSTLASIAAGDTIAPLEAALTRRNLATPVPVYNFGVAGNHNYFAGPDAILCHNTPPGGGAPSYGMKH